MVYPTGTRYPSETRRVQVRVPIFTHGYEILPTVYVLAGEYLLYPPRTRSIAITISPQLVCDGNL
jgi:hypothetical protein